LKAVFLLRRTAGKPLSFSSSASFETTSARKDDLAASPASDSRVLKCGF
jgi:hypothetical protein